MVVDKVGGVGPGYGPKKIQGKAETVRADAPRDNVTISDEAVRQQTLDRVKRLALSTENKNERLKEIREKLEKGVYDSPTDEMLSQAAERIAESFLSRT